MVAGRRLSGRLVGAVLTLGLAASALAVVVAAPALAATDLAAGKPASADSAQTSRGPSSANDGNTGTRWCAADGRTGHWWQVDLGKATNLTSTQVVWEFARNYRYQIAVSVDGTTWTTAVDRSADVSTAQERTDTFTATGRYLRITVTGLVANTWASIQEFRAYGVPTSDPSTGPEPDPAQRAKCTGAAPIHCHYDLAPGHYQVTVVLGDRASAGVTSMAAEARRTVLPEVATARGQLLRYTVTLNVRQPEGQPTGQGGTGTPGLDLVFAGSAPRLHGIGIAAASAPLVLYLAGDSTVCDQPTAPYSAWGQQLPQYFEPGISVANYGDSGESSGSFLNNSALFPVMRPLIKADDVVLIQFGHNDKNVTAAQFTTNLNTIISGVRGRGGIPVLVTPPVRRQFTGTQLNNTGLHINGLGTNLPVTMRQVAAAQRVPLIDLTAKSEALVEGLGVAASAAIFLNRTDDGIEDNTHFSSDGATKMAELVIEGIRELNLSPEAYLR